MSRPTWQIRYKSLDSAALSKRVLEVLSSEKGNVESALTLIPLLILFLTVGQLCLSVYSRNLKSVETQGDIAYAAMGAVHSSGTHASGSSSLDPGWSAPPIALPLPGGGSLLVGERKFNGTSITPLLPQGDPFTTAGVAVQE